MSLVSALNLIVEYEEANLDSCCHTNMNLLPLFQIHALYMLIYLLPLFESENYISIHAQEFLLHLKQRIFRFLSEKEPSLIAQVLLHLLLDAWRFSIGFLTSCEVLLSAVRLFCYV